MKTSDAMTVLKEMAPIFAQRGVIGLSVFGSQMAGTAHRDSDLDILVDYDPDSRFSLLDLVAISRLIEERLGIKADVVTRSGLHPIIKDAIEKSAVRVY